MVTLLPAQQEIFDKWNTTKRGCIETPTGSGKSYLGLKAIEHYQNSNVYIIVPTISLAHQWQRHIKRQFDKDAQLICSNGGSTTSNIKIAVVNSVRWQSLSMDLLILDEVHRMASKCNISFIPVSHFYAIMGLSATVERSDGLEKKIYPYAPLIYKMNLDTAQKLNLLSRYTVCNISIAPEPSVASVLKEHTNVIRQGMVAYRDLQHIRLGAVYGDMLAKQALAAIQARVDIFATSKQKLDVVQSLLSCHKSDKVIVFSERIENLATLQSSERYVYSSNMKDEEKKVALEQFKVCTSGVLLCVRALDEGINVPDANVAVVISSSSTKRQTIQRLGRILRYVEGKKCVLYQLYLDGTKDYDNVLKRTTAIREGAETVKWVDMSGVKI